MKITKHVIKITKYRQIFRYFFPLLFIFLVFIFGSVIFLNSYHTNPNIAKKYSSYHPILSPEPTLYKFTDSFPYNNDLAKKNILTYIHKFLRPVNTPPDNVIEIAQAYIFGRDKTPDLPYTFGASWSLDPNSDTIVKTIFHYNEKTNIERDNTIFVTFASSGKTAQDVHNLLDYFFITEPIAPYKLKCQDVDSTTDCEYFYTDKNGTKRGIGGKLNIPIGGSKLGEYIFYCEMPKGSSNYAWKSCLQWRADTGV